MRFWSVVRAQAFDTQRLATSLRVTCQEVRLICSEGKAVFQGLSLTPKLPLDPIFDPESHLGAQLATVRRQEWTIQ